MGKSKVKAAASAAAGGTKGKDIKATNDDEGNNKKVAPQKTQQEASMSGGDTMEFQYLGSLATEMEEQLMQEFEFLLARKRGGKDDTNDAGAMKLDALRPTGKDEEARNAIYWKHMYERLRDLRESEAEKMLAEVSRHADEREKTLLDLVEHLQTQPTRSETAQAALMASVKEIRLSLGGGAATATVAAASGGANESAEGNEEAMEGISTAATSSTPVATTDERIMDLEAKIASLKRVLLGYQRLTSLCINLEEAPPATATTASERLSRLNCTAINHVHKRALKFQLEVNCDQEDVYDLDAKFKPVANFNHLPKYLRQEATLETKQCPLLVLAILRSLYDGRE